MNSRTASSLSRYVVGLMPSFTIFNINWKQSWNLRISLIPLHGRANAQLYNFLIKIKNSPEVSAYLRCLKSLNSCILYWFLLFVITIWQLRSLKNLLRPYFCTTLWILIIMGQPYTTLHCTDLISQFQYYTIYWLLCANKFKPELRKAKLTYAVPLMINLR